MKIAEEASYRDGQTLYVAIDAKNRDDLVDDQVANARDTLAMKEASRRNLSVMGVAGLYTVGPIDDDGKMITEQALMDGNFSVAGYRAIVKLAVQ